MVYWSMSTFVPFRTAEGSYERINRCAFVPVRRCLVAVGRMMVPKGEAHPCIRCATGRPFVASGSAIQCHKGIHMAGLKSVFLQLRRAAQPCDKAVA